jgi:hypothetical protein
MSSVVIFLGTEEAFDKIWYLSLLYEYAKLQFPVRIMKLIYSSLSIRKWDVSTNCEVAVPREIQQGYHWVKFLILHSLYINNTPTNTRYLYSHWVL